MAVESFITMTPEVVEKMLDKYKVYFPALGWYSQSVFHNCYDHSNGRGPLTTKGQT